MADFPRPQLFLKHLKLSDGVAKPVPFVQRPAILQVSREPGPVAEGDIASHCGKLAWMGRAQLAEPALLFAVDEAFEGSIVDIIATPLFDCVIL